jgi:hypothetical protein
MCLTRRDRPVTLCHKFAVLCLLSVQCLPAWAQCGLQWLPQQGSGGLPRLARTATGDVLAFGSFTSIEGVPANAIARFDGSTWHPLGSGLAGTVTCVAELPGGRVVAGGIIAPAGGNPTPRLLGWDGMVWSAFAPAPSSGIGIEAMVSLPNGAVVVGGSWSTSPFTGATHVESWDGSNWQIIGTAFGVGSHRPLASLLDLGVLPSGDLIALGDWIGLQPVGNLAGNNELVRWDGAAWHHFGERPEPRALRVARNGDVLFAHGSGVRRWDGVAWQTIGTASDIMALVDLPDGDVVLGGGTAVLPFAPPPALLRRWSGTSQSLLASGAAGVVVNLAFHARGVLMVSGELFDATGTPTTGRYLATTCGATASVGGTACIGPGGPVRLVAVALPWVGSTARTKAAGFAGNAVAVAILGLRTAQVPLTALHPSGLPGCDLLTTSEVTVLALPAGGAVDFSLAIPDAPWLAGLVLNHQFLQADLGPSGGLTTLSSSNRLTLTLGAY